MFTMREVFSFADFLEGEIEVAATERSDRMAKAGRLGTLLTSLCLWGAGCGIPAAHTGDEATAAWLSSVGFPIRSRWTSTTLYFRVGEIPPSVPLTTLLEGTPGLKVDRRSRGGWGLRQIRPQEGDTCSLHVYLNGTRLEPFDLQAPIQLDAFVPTRALDGLELHTGPGGPTFEPDGCGALLLWSAEMRRREDLPFRGRIMGRVWSAPPDTVIGVKLESSGESRSPDPEGRFSFPDLLPGLYHLSFHGSAGAITTQDLRVYAHQVSRLDLEVGR